jgi:hypothetical protein
VNTRLAASIALAAAVMVGVSGCTFGANIATQKDYDPSDGVGTTIEQVAVRNAMLIGDDNEVLNLVMTVANNSDEQQTLTVQWEAGGSRETETVTLAPLALTSIGGPDDEQSVLVRDTGATMGGLHPVFFTYGTAEGSEILVPVLDGSLPEYELFVPSSN